MTKYEFLEKMRHALANDLDGSVVQENVNYYDSYISEEVRKGRSEEAVIEELGDPWAMARSIIDMAENSGNAGGEYMYDSGRQVYEDGRRQGRNHVYVFGLGPWWKKLLLVLGLLGIIMVVATVVGGIFSLLAPVIVPVLIVMFILRMTGRWRR